MLKDHQDAYGHAFYEYLLSKAGSEVIERDDGYVDTDLLKGYFSEYRSWHPSQRKAMRYARGRVLDIGCGAGRHSLYLQSKGLEVVGIDNSPLALHVCRLRGLKQTEAMSLGQISSKLGVIDTALMLGNNFGLVGSSDGAKRFLKRLHRVTSQKGRIIAETVDPHGTDNPEHLKYQERNRHRGRMSGQIRLRVRHRQYSTPWFDLLLVSKSEMENILDGTGWQVREYLDSGDVYYIAIIDKKRG